MWGFFGFDRIKEKNKEFENQICQLNINIAQLNKDKTNLQEEINKLNNKIIQLKDELKINNEIIENLYTDDDKDLLKQYKLKLINLNKYKETTNNKIITLEEYNKTLRNELCTLRAKYDKVNKLSNYRKERNDKLESKLEEKQKND